MSANIRAYVSGAQVVQHSGWTFVIPRILRESWTQEELLRVAHLAVDEHGCCRKNRWGPATVCNMGGR